MSGVPRPLAVLVLIALALAPARAQAPAWLAEFERLMSSGAAPQAFAHLESIPLDARKSADHEWARARVHRALDKPEAAAMDLVTYDILTRRKGRDVADLRGWLGAQGQRLLAQAINQLHAGDKPGAVRTYLHAALCDQALLKKPAEGLRESTGASLSKLVHSHPEKPDYWVLLAGFHFHMDHLDAARAAMLHYIKQPLDEYHQWRAHVWLGSIDRALAKNTALADKLMREAAAESANAPPAPPPAPEPEPPKPSAEPLAQTLERNRKLVDLDARIRDTENHIAVLKSRRTGRTYVTPGGLPVVSAYNQRQVKADLEAAEKRLSDLVTERDSY